MGHAIVSRHAIQDHAPRSKLHAARIVSPQLVSRLIIATSRQRPLTRLAEQTVSLVKSVITRELPESAVGAPLAARLQPPPTPLPCRAAQTQKKENP
jgi:hypothetical protein